jgi:uncharacterized membrane protein required for colicin V production
MNLLDYSIVALAACGAIYGLSRGVLRMLTSALSLMAALYLASVHHAAAGAFAQRELGLYPSIATAAGYIAIFVLVFATVEATGNILMRVMHTVHLSWLDRCGGGVLGAGIAIAFAGLALVILTALLPPNATLLRDSRFAPEVEAYNVTLLNYLPAELRDGYFQQRQALIKYWMEHENALDPTKRSASNASR